MVQAWPMPWRAPAAGVLGPCPGTPPQQAYTAMQHQPSTLTMPMVWDQASLIAALANTGVQSPPATSTSDWILDTGASSHMSSNPGILHSSLPPPPHLFPSSIMVGNGDQLPVTSGHSTISTLSSPLKLYNVLISPQLDKNLISVRVVTRDNSVSVEFDPYDFSIKDLQTRTTILRCNSSGDLYPLHCAVPQALHAFSVSADRWHQRLGHPGRDSLRRTLQSFDFLCNKSASHICPAYQLGKHVRLPFQSSESYSFFPFQIIHADVWTLPHS